MAEQDLQQHFLFVELRHFLSINMTEPNLDEIASEIGIPAKELEKLLAREYDKEGRLPTPYGYKHTKYAQKLIEGIREELATAFAGRKDFLKNLSTAYRLIMCNMVSCVFDRSCLSLSGSEKDYNKGTYYNKLFLTWAAVDRVTKALIKHGYIKKNQGSKSSKKVNNYYPTRKLELLALPLLYSVQEEYTSKTELIIMSKKDKKADRAAPPSRADIDTMRRSSIELETTYSTDLEALTRINLALKDCTYALKSPVKRIYSEEHPMKGGRLYTRLQGLPDRRARIRINTLFNGEPVAEVDLSANHPRMLMALAKKELSATFYYDVANATKTTREQVKFLLVKAIGAKDRRISLKPKGDEKEWTSDHFVLTHTQRKLLERHLAEHYPDISNWLYKDMGVHLQAFEGDILLKAMLTLLDQGIPSLPVHDAIYVQQSHSKVAKAALEEAWKEELNVAFLPVTKIDLP